MSRYVLQARCYRALERALIGLDSVLIECPSNGQIHTQIIIQRSRVGGGGRKTVFAIQADHGGPTTLPL